MKIRGWMLCLLLLLLSGVLSGCSAVSATEQRNETKKEAKAETKTMAPADEKAQTQTEEETESVTEAVSETSDIETAGETTLAEQLEAVSESVTEAVTEEETEYSNGHIVAVDPGHQGQWVDMSAQEPMAPGSTQTKAKCTTGTTGRFTGVPEYQLNLDISLALRTELEERGYQVILTREDNDAAISNSERAIMAAEKGGEIYVRIHANGSDDPSVSGALAMTMSPQNPYVGTLYEQSYALALAIMKAYCAATGFADLGIQYTDGMTGINWSRIPVMILEMGFMTNQSDDTLMQDPAMQEKMVQGIADGIDDYYQLPHDAAEKAREAAGSSRKKAGSGQTDPENLIEDPSEASEGADTPEELDGPAALLYEQYIAGREMMGEKWAFAISSPSSGKIRSWRGSEAMQSASVIKLFIMGAVYDRMCYPKTQDRLIPFHESYDGELRAVLEQMITVSSNEAANRLIDALGQGDTRAGKEVVNEFCREYGFHSTHLGRKFMETAPADDNYTSALDTADLLSRLLEGTLVNADASEKMLTILKGQTVRGKIPSGLPADFTSANKTGEMPEGYGLGCIENDAAIIWPSSGEPYVLAILSNDLGGRNSEAAQTIRDIAGFTAAHAGEWPAGETEQTP